MSFLDWDFVKLEADLFTDMTFGIDPVNAIAGTGSLYAFHQEGDAELLGIPKTTSGYPQAKTSGRLRTAIKILDAPGHAGSTQGNANSAPGNRASLVCQLGLRTDRIPSYMFSLCYTTDLAQVAFDISQVFYSLGLRQWAAFEPAIAFQDVFGTPLQLGEIVTLEFTWYADPVQVNGVIFQGKVGRLLDYSDLIQIYTNVLDVSGQVLMTTVGEGIHSIGYNGTYVLFDRTHFNELIFS